MVQDVHELISLLKRAASTLKEASVKVNEVFYTLSTVVGMLESFKLPEAPKEVGTAVEGKVEEVAPSEVVAVGPPEAARGEAAARADVAVEASGEERLVKVSERVRKPIEDRFKRLEALIVEGTKPGEIAEELLSMKSWIYEEYPSFLPIVYHIDMWSRKLKSYVGPTLSPSDKDRLLFSVAEWKERMMKAK
ncbi:MAG: hypothetical protein KIH01_07880 [Candidatus Freyarchaeota archaeon]|nr:hypothetical protein [Candidatus Jordarchaeia archaeon]